ncbi:MAG TPA: hemerythrin domain-containing protein [Casimicrobiaceae bacterium]|nr:hemerythrin domain-containing protein [Casimicrobiaceae bacterium]
MNALALLKADHDNVDKMFKQYERMKEGDERKQALCQVIIEELRVHAQVEEELLYPALKTLFEEERPKDVDLIPEANVEHATVKWLIEQLESGDQSDEETTDARVKVLSEYVKHHVQEEEGRIFKAAKRVDLDLDELGALMDARKRQLKGEAPDEDQSGDMSEDGMQINEPAQMAGPVTH